MFSKSMFVASASSSEVCDSSFPLKAALIFRDAQAGARLHMLLSSQLASDKGETT